MTIKKNTYQFKSEVKQLLNLVINSLYSNKEIFLRELISNASDAIEKLRFNRLINSKQYVSQEEVFKIKISINKKEKTISISDNGIGMKYDEVINNLGTIAKSGTKSFLKKIKENGTISQTDFIGQFGVGFYSSFIVAEKVSVYTKYATEKTNIGTLWESNGLGDYNIQEIEKKEYGTTIILSIKDQEKEFLENWKIQQIIKKYSDHIITPIEIENYNKKTNTISWEQINQAKAIWVKSKLDIQKKEYEEFYSYISNDSEKPLIWSHNKVEGTNEYISLLYIPRKATWDMWQRENKHGLKLYVKHVYIMDDATQFLPNYLRFIKGIVDSQDLPLNISREILQNNYITKSLKKSLTKRVLNILVNLAEKDEKKYKIFWNAFGLILKEGLAEDINNQKILSNLLRFNSLKYQEKEKTISLIEYVNSMVENQQKIYFITAENFISAINSPHLEFFKENNIDVLLLTDRVDEWMMNYLPEFQGKKFQSVNKSDTSLEEIVKKNKIEVNKTPKELEKFIEKIKNILKDRIKDVKITYRLKETPIVAITDTNDMSTQMAKLFQNAGQPVPKIKYILEINPNHELIQKIQNIDSEKELLPWIEVLFEEAILSEQGSLENPHLFIKRINKLLIEK